jgi:uncharacterized protein (DUF1330 family)
MTASTRKDESMKTNFKVALGALAGIAIGVASATAIYARQVKTPPAYVISEADEIQDLPMVQKYGEKVGETLAPFNHHFIVAGGKMHALDGELPKGMVVIAFDSADKAQEWYDSAAYQAIKPLRVNSTKGRMFIVEGIAQK